MFFVLVLLLFCWGVDVVYVFLGCYMVLVLRNVWMCESFGLVC